MEHKKVIFKLENGFASYKKWIENKSTSGQEGKLVYKEGVIHRFEECKEEVRLINDIFNPYLKEILAQFSQK
jgi:hypothetical protein